MHINDVTRACNRAGGWPARAALIAAIAVAVAVAGCAGQPRPPGTEDLRVDASQLDSPQVKQRAAYEYHVLAGEMAIQRGKSTLAAREYVAALEYSDDGALAKRATRIALYAGEPELAYRAAATWATGAPASLDAQRTAARLALTNGDREGLAIYAPAVVVATNSAKAGYRLLAKLLGGEAEHADLAIETASRLAQVNSDSAPAQHALGVVALGYNRNEVAARAAQRALRLDPDSSNAVLLQAGVWVRSGRIDPAQQLVADLPGNEVKRAQYHLALARLLVEADQDSAALDEFDRALRLQPSNTDARYGLAILALSIGDLDRAEAALMRLYENDERADDAAYYLGTIHEERRDFDTARLWYQRVRNGSHAFESQVRAARMFYEQGDLAAARQRMSELRKRYPDLADQIYGAEGQLLFDANQPRAALNIYNRGLEEEDDSLELYYGRSVVYERLGRIAEAEADLRTMLATDPNDTRALNALGYLLANHSERYQEALDYVQQALEAEPENPAILDSMGWVQYRLGHLAQARNYLERAYQAYPDPEVAAHLGEVLWQQDNREAARRLWQDALVDNPDHRVLRETTERLLP